MQLQEFIKNIADTLKVDATKLTEALNSKEDITLELPKLKVYTEDEFIQLENNLKGGSYKEGKIAGTEMTAKELKKLAGVDVESKDISKIVEAIVNKTKADAKIEPNKKVEELQQSIAELQKTVETQKQENETLKSNFSKQQLEHKILGLIPSNSIGLDNKTILNDMRSNGYDVAEVDGVLTVTKDGNTLKDNLQNPLKFDTVANQYLQEKNWLKIDKGGRGGGDEGLGGSSITIKSMEDFEKYTKEKGISPMSNEAKAILIEARKENNF